MMAKLYSLNAAKTPSKQPPSDVAIAITSWLKRKAANTSRVYRGIASDWSVYLGAGLEDPKAGKLWKTANHTDAQRYLHEVSRRPAQSGRPSARHKTVSTATVRHKATILMAIYDELMAQGLCERNPFVRVRGEYERAKSGERRPHERVESDAVKRLLTAPDLGSLAGLGPEFRRAIKEAIRNYALLCLLFGCALRRSEAIKLTVGDVCTTSSGTVYMTLRNTKSGHEVEEHTVADWIASALRELVKVRREEGAKDEAPLIVCYYGSGIPDHDPMSESTVYRLFKSLCKAAGLPESITPHCARVTAITRMLDQGISHRDVKEFSRHSSVTMVERYDRKRKSIEESVAKKIEY